MAKKPDPDRKLAKKRFIEEYNKFKRDTNKSDLQISEELDIGLSTMKDTLHPTKPNFNADFVIAFCLEYKTTDIHYIYKGIKEDPAVPSETSRGFTTFRHSIDCHALEDDAFMGTFYGYCRNTQHHDILEKFTLTVDRTPRNTVQATLVLNSHNQRDEMTQKTLYGKPMHLEPYIIYIVFQSEKGDDMFILSYNWFKINHGNKLYCRYGSTITLCRATDRFPQLQSFVLLDQPVLPENLHYIDGFLRLTQDKIIVPAEAYDAGAGGLMATSKPVMEFFSRCRDLHYHKEECYCFSEKVLLALGEANGIDTETTAAAIMTLKEKAINPKVVDFPNNKTYSKFLFSLTTQRQ